MDTINTWLSGRLAAGPQDKRRLVRVAEAFEQINASAREAEEYNLERKPLIFNMFGRLAEVTRG
jgi:DNA polymerase-3 subunit delta'